jgi:hypothetical protein
MTYQYKPKRRSDTRGRGSSAGAGSQARATAAKRARTWHLAGLKALEFLERSREMAAEPVIATPLLLPSRATRP